MLEIDIVKASSNHHQTKSSSLYASDDTDISEVDTALNTPILTDNSVKRFSTVSSTSSFNTLKSYRKPSMTPKSCDDTVPLLEKRLHIMEQELNEHIKRELDLEAQLLQQKKDSCYKTTLSKINKRIDQFLQSKQYPDTNNNPINFNTINCYDWLVGNELPSLFVNHFMQSPCNTASHGETENDNECGNMLSLNKIFIHRLRTIMKQHQHQDDLYDQFYIALNAWEQHEDQRQLEIYEQQARDNNTVTRLLEALNKSLLRNKMQRKDSNLIIKKHQSDLKKILKEKDQQIAKLLQHQQGKNNLESKQKQATKDNHQTCEAKLLNLKNVMDRQIKDLNKSLVDCQEERDEYETTVEMVRREMETMLEELEDTRQQRLRFKTQASRLRAGLEAIQKKKKASDNDTSSSSEDEEEDEAKEAIRLMYNEAERQAMDLDRECKRQALTLSSIRKELKVAEEKYHSLKTLKNKQIHQIEQENRDLSRKVQLLQMEKQNLTSSIKENQHNKTDNVSMMTAVEDNDEQQCMYQAKIYTLQIALKAAKSDASIQRTKIFQLERQASLMDLSHSIAQLQDLFQKQLPSTCSNDSVNKSVAERIEYEQVLWKSKLKKSLQKRYDVDLLRVNREIRHLSGRIVELEDETEALTMSHKEELKRVKHKERQESDKKLQKVISSQKIKEKEWQNEIDVVYQTNQTLQDELLVLCGRNLMMANQLGKAITE